MTHFDVLGIGSPFLDTIIHVDEDFLRYIPGKKGGMEPISYEEMQEIIKQADGRTLTFSGGSCSNTIKGLSYLGLHCALFGVIGQDKAARQYMSFIRKSGIVPLFQVSNSYTSQAVCLVTPDGERTCRSFLGASRDIKLENVTPELFKNVKLVHIEGYSLLQGILPEKAMQLAKAAGAKISFDLASFELVEEFKERILVLLSRFVDIAFANDDEIKMLTGVGGQKGCQYLKDISEMAVVKQREQGCWVGQSDALIHKPALEVQMVDSTGAGDLFASGFLAAYLSGKSLEECAHMGNLVGAAAVQINGTEISQEHWERLRKSLQSAS